MCVRFVGLLVKASVSRAADPGLDSLFLYGDFSGSSHISDLKLGIPVASLPGAWHYKVNSGTGWPGVSVLFRDGEIEHLICNFDLSVAAQTIV